MESPLHVLCVDDDPEFCSYLQLLVRPYNLILKTCYSIAEAKALIEQEKFDAYLIDISLGDGSGLDLAAWIRQTQGQSIPIAVVSGVQKDVATFRQVKEKLAINYVIDKPLKPQEVRSLFDNLTKHKVRSASSSDTPVKDAAFLEIKQQYDKTICDKIDQLDQLIKNVKTAANQESLRALSALAHKIAGSAATYGYPGVTTECRALEHKLLDSVHLLEKDPEAFILLPDLETFLREVKKNFQMVALEEVDPYLKPQIGSKERPYVYLVSSDRTFLDLIDQNEVKFAIDVITESNPSQAMEKLADINFNPQIVIVDRFFRGGEITGEQVLDVIRNKKSDFSTEFGMLVDTEDLDTRIEIIQKGIKHVFHWPIAPDILLSSLQKIVQSEHLPGFKVLVVDDDPDICNFLTLILSEKGMEVKSLYDGSNLFETLRTFNPNCLLLDIMLPKHSGTQILKALHADPRYANLAIIIITVSRDEEVRRLAYESNVDDILYKPLDKKLVQTRIYNIAMRNEQNEKVTDLDPLTGLPSQRAFYYFLHQHLNRNEKHAAPALLALIGIDQFNDLENSATALDLEKVVIATAYTLTHDLSESLLTAYLGEGRFAIMHDPKDLDIFVEKLSQVLTRGLQEITRYNEKLSYLTYSCGITSFSSHFKSVDLAVKSVEEALKGAETSKDRTPPVTIFMHPIDEKAKRDRTEVVLIDGDEYLLEILQSSFRAQGLKTTTYTSGKKALDHLLGRTPAEQPSLIISERNLVDMDGIEILKTLQRKQAIPPPFIFLSTFSSEKDVFEGLNDGAQDYIAKPFNLKILMKKANALLF